MKDFKIKFKNGFTLVELLIVIAVVGILAIGTINIINPVGQFQKANDAKRKSDLEQIQKAMKAYYQDTGRYPPNYFLPNLGPNTYQIQRLEDGNAVDWGTSWTPYMSTLPKDPGSKNYVYYVSQDGQSYYIYASLDRETNDPQVCNDGNVCVGYTSNNLRENACGGICNYGVSSPNVSP